MQQSLYSRSFQKIKFKRHGPRYPLFMQKAGWQRSTPIIF